eukprot:UN1514
MLVVNRCRLQLTLESLLHTSCSGYQRSCIRATETTLHPTCAAERLMFTLVLKRCCVRVAASIRGHRSVSCEVRPHMSCTALQWARQWKPSSIAYELHQPPIGVIRFDCSSIASELRRLPLVINKFVMEQYGVRFARTCSGGARAGRV